VLREFRPDVLAALRDAAADQHADRQLRSAALVALGRTGAGRDAALCVRVLRDPRAPSGVKDSAAVALGLLRGVGVDAGVRELVDDLADLPARTRGLVLLSAGLRAREDRALATRLLGRIAKGKASAELLLACGWAGEVRCLPELIDAAAKGRDDIARAHAAIALGRVGDPAAATVLVRILKSRNAGVQAKRAAALSLGRMLRQGLDRPDVRKALAQTVRNKGDATVRGFAALALASAKQPDTRDIDKLLDGGRMELRPFAALALGVAARNVDGPGKTKIRKRLVDALERSKGIELGSALNIAVGLAGAQDALDTLLARVAKRSLPADVRGTAAVGAGILGVNSARVEKVLLGALDDVPSGDVALGLGLTGRTTVARVLLDRIPKAGSSMERGRLVMALGYLGSGASVEPLLKTLMDRKAKATDRAQAALALGLLGDTRDKDPLFDLAVDFNMFATTRTTRELLNQM
jgi:HEAT repeat protein